MLAGSWHIVIGQECWGHTEIIKDRLYFRIWKGLLLAFNMDTFQDGIEWEELENFTPKAPTTRRNIIIF